MEGEESNREGANGILEKRTVTTGNASICGTVIEKSMGSQSETERRGRTPRLG